MYKSIDGIPLLEPHEVAKTRQEAYEQGLVEGRRQGQAAAGASAASSAPAVPRAAHAPIPAPPAPQPAARVPASPPPARTATHAGDPTGFVAHFRKMTGRSPLETSKSKEPTADDLWESVIANSRWNRKTATA